VTCELAVIRQEACKCVSKYSPKYGSSGKGGILCGKAIQHIKHLGPGITKENTTWYERTGKCIPGEAV